MKKQKWFIQNKKADFNKIARKFNIDPVIARLIRNRDIIEESDIDIFLNGGVNNLYSPFELSQVSEAVDLIYEKITQDMPIRIIGDYDIDGVMSTYILVEGLSRVGAMVDYAIPHRVLDGYGLNERLIEEAYNDGVDTVITCDNGIAAIKQISRAKELGMTVIVTDHHEILFEEDIEGEKHYIYPQADCVIDPKKPDESYPFRDICGAVVAFKVIEGLWTRYFPEENAVENFIEMAAFATIGDVMNLVDENRIIVKEGLERLKNTKNIGLKQLLSATGMIGKQISPYHVGFILGPCVNATGRLDSAERAIRLLMEEDSDEAAQIAQVLVSLNDGRKEMTNRGVLEAIEYIESRELDLNCNVLVVYLSQVHESLAGIIAGKIKERYYKPTFILTDGEDGIKGSGRSIESYDMFAELTKVSDLLTKFGGHKMAAGVSLEKANIEAFSTQLNSLCTLTEEDFTENVLIDIAMPFSYVTKQFIKQLDVLGPFGNGNPKPIFARKNLTVVKSQVFGKNMNVGKYTVKEEDGSVFTLTAFGDQNALQRRIEEGEPLAVCYYPDVNEYNGREEIQFVLKDYK